MLDAIVLQGQGVRLEPLSRAHVPGLLAAADGPRDTFQFTNITPDEPAMWRWVDAAIAAWFSGTALPFATIDQATGDVVGSTRYSLGDPGDRPAENSRRREAPLPYVIEIGWVWLAPKAQRTSINVEANLLMLQHAFEVWHVHRVIFSADVRNTRSRNAIVGLGGHLDGIQGDDSVPHTRLNQVLAMYSIVDSEWPRVKAHLTQRLASHDKRVKARLIRRLASHERQLS